MTALRKWDEPRPVKLTVEDFLRLDAAGAFSAYAKTELIEGVIVAINAQHAAHARAQGRLFRRLAQAVEQSLPGHEALIEASIDTPPGNVPQPDILIAADPPEQGLVPVASVALIVEVSDTTLAFDLGTKAEAYAANGVGEYWVVDLPGGRVHQFWSPAADGYAERRETALGEPVEAETLAGLRVETGGI